MILYLNEHEDAKETTALVEKEGRRCLAIAGNIGMRNFAMRVLSFLTERTAEVA